MNVYFYDAFVSEGKNNKTIAKIEIRLTDLGLNGKIIRLGAIKSIDKLLEDELRRGAKNIIAVGNDFLFEDILNSFIKLNNQNNIPIGFIPVGNKNNSIAKKLNIKKEEDACDILSARIIKTIHPLKINNTYFLFEAEIDSKNTSVQIDDDYSIEILKQGKFYIKNTPITNKQKPTLEITTSAGAFSFYKQNKNQSSVIPFNSLLIQSKENKVLIDKTKTISCPAQIIQSSKQINIITGKNSII